MKNKLFRIILKVHKKLSFIPFEKELIRIYHLFQEKRGIVNTNVNGINYRLDLSELIDNKVFYGNWEPETTKMFNRIIKPGLTVLDVGANMGYYTLLSAKLMKGTGKIYAFEPTSGGFKRLKTNISLNNFNNIKIENIGLSNENKKIKAKIRHSWKLDGLVEPKEDNINMMKLDDYLQKTKINKVNFIKIDVDGYEYEVLKGAEKTLKKDKPVLCLEMGDYEGKNPGYSRQEIISLLNSLNYSFHYEDGRLISSKEIILGKGTINLFLFNKEIKKINKSF